MPTKKFSELREALAKQPGHEERAIVAEHALMEEIRLHDRTLADLRKARRLTQADLASTSGKTQPEISRIEHQTDLYISTLRDYLRGLGGELMLVARFGDEGTMVRMEMDEVAGAAFRDEGDTSPDADPDSFAVCN